MKIGFSTTNSWVSRSIRWVTGSSVSHAYIEFEWLGRPFIMDADWSGVRIVPREKFRDQVVALIPVQVDLHLAFDFVGDRYDYGGLLGMGWVILGRFLKRKWRNPFANARARFCSEMIVHMLQRAHYPGSGSLDPSTTSPQDLLEFLQAQE